MTDIVEKIVTEEATALEKFIEMRLKSIPQRLWNNIQLVKCTKVEDSKIITTWNVKYDPKKKGVAQMIKKIAFNPVGAETGRLSSNTATYRGSLEVSEDKKSVAIFYQTGDKSTKIAEFDICTFWDMVRDAIASVDVDKSQPGLFRRKGEAVASILHTTNLFEKFCI